MSERLECPYCKSYAVKPKSPDPDVGYLWSRPNDSPMKQLEADNEMLGRKLNLYIQRASYETAWRIAERGDDYSLAVHTLRDLPLTKEANLSDLAWALASPQSGYCSKGDWEGFREFWDDAWGEAWDALKEKP